MKIIKLTSLIFCFMCFAIISRAQYYSLSYSQQAYTDLSGATSLNSGLTWDEPDFVAPIGFDFTALDHTNDELYFIDGSGSILTLDSTNGEYVLISPLFNDIIDRGFSLASGLEGEPGSLSPISYKLEGSAGSRVFKLQWKNFGFRSEYEIDTMADASWNMQLWLYEGTNVIEFRYGPSNLPVVSECFFGLPGPFTGIFGANQIDFNQVYMPSQDPFAPTLKIGSSVNDFGILTDTIATGMVYTFTPVPASVTQVDDQSSLQLYPNPTTSIVHIANIDVRNIESVEVWNTVGQKCIELDATANIDLSAQPAGLYMIRVRTADGTFVGSALLE